MKICSTCGFECEDGITVCPTCGKSTDGSEKDTDSRQQNDPFEEYRRQIESRMREQENRINAIKEQMSSKADNEAAEDKKKTDRAEKKAQWDKTDYFTADDIENYRVVCALAYLAGIFGIIAALLTDRESQYLAFHIKESLKITVCAAFLSMASLLFSWTVIVPFLCIAGLFVLAVVSIISAVWALQGKSVHAVIIRNLTILN